jgi:Flp pilus assembly protein TadD
MKTDPAPIPTPEAVADAFSQLVTAGCEALNAGELEQARSSFEAAVARFPAEPVGHNNLGAFYMGLGDFAAAADCFARVTELIPGHANSQFNLAMARFQQGDFGDAATLFEGVVALTPEDPEALNNLGAARFMAGELSEARRHFTAALTLQPNYPNAVLNLCDVELMEGNTDAARELCEAYLEHNHDLGVLRRLLELLDEQARSAVEEAIPHAEAIIAASDEDRATRRHLGRLLEARQALTAEG